NPGKLRRRNDHVLEVVQPIQPVQATGDMLSFASADDALGAQAFIDQALHMQPDYLTDPRLFNKTTNITPLFADPTKSSMSKQAGTFSQTIQSSPGQAMSLYVNTS